MGFVPEWNAFWNELLLISQIVIVTVLGLYVLYRSKRISKEIGEIENLLKAFNNLKAGIKAVKEQLGIEETGVSEKLEILTVAEASARINFNIKDIYTPKITVGGKKSLTICESKPFKKKFKNFLHVELDALSQLVLSLEGDVERFIELKVTIYDKEVMAVLDKSRRETSIMLSRIGKRSFNVIVEGVADRVDEDIKAYLSLNAKLNILK